MTPKVNFKTHWFGRYAFAIGGVVAALLLRQGLTRLVGPGLPTYVTYYPVVMLAALLGGFGPGLLATVAAALVTVWWTFSPAGELTIPTLADAVGLAIFCGMGVFMSVVAALYRRARQKALAPEEGVAAWHSPATRHPPVLEHWLLTAGFVLSLMILAVVGQQTYRNLKAMIEADRLENQSYIVIRELDRLFSLVIDAETSDRGFTITGDEQYLEPYHAALRQIELSLVSLKRLVAGNPPKEEHLTGLSSIIQQRLAAIDKNLAVRRSGGFEAARQAVMTGVGRHLMEDIRRRVRAMQDQEEQLLQSRVAEHQADVRRTEMALLAGSMLSLLLLVAVFLFLKQENTRRLEMEIELRGHRDHLQDLVSARTAELGQTNDQLKREIEEHQHAKEALRQQREWLQVTLNSIGDGVLATDTHGRITFLNPVAQKLTGWTGKDALAQSAGDIFRIMVEPIRQPAEDLIARVLREGRVVTLANHPTLVARDGSEIPIEDSAAPIRDTAGNVSGVVLVFHDVTEKRRAQVALAAKEERLRLAVSAGRLATWDWHVPSGEVRWNDEYYRIMGYEPGTISPSNPASMDRVHPDDRAAVEAAFQRTTNAGGDYSAEFRTLWPDSTIRWVEARGQCEFDSEGRAFRSFGVLHDITDRKRAEEQVRRMNIELERRVAEQTAELRQARDLLEQRIAARTIELQLANDHLRASRLAALNLMEDAIEARRRAEQAGGELQQEITERKEIEVELQRANEELERRVIERTAELREKSRFLEAFFSHSLDSLVFLDKQCNFIRVNEAYAKACGRNASEFPGHNHFEFYPDADIQAIFAEVARSKQPFVAQARAFEFPDHPEWGVTYWDWTLVAVLDAAGGVDFLVFSLRDVTQRELAQQRVRAASRYARSLLEASLDPLVTISPAGKITDVNDATELVTGIGREQLIGSDFADFFTDADQARRGYQQVISEGLVRDYPLTIRHVSGRTTDVVYNATVYRNEAGEVQGVFAAARDITERKRVERALRGSEARYRSLVTASARIVWTTNPEGQVVDDLSEWRAFTGQSAADALGWGWSGAVHPEDQERVRSVWQRAVQTRTLYEVEYRLRHHSGEYRDVSVRGVPVLDSDGVLREWVGTCTDITPQKDAARKRSFTSALLELFARNSSSKEYLDAVVEAIRDWSGSQAMGIRVTDESGLIRYESQVGFEPGFLQIEDALSLENSSCCCARVVTQAMEPSDRDLLTGGGSFRSDDFRDFLRGLQPAFRARYRDSCARHGFASLAIVPVRFRDQILGVIHMADRRPGRFPAATVEFIESVTPLIGEAIRRFYAEAELCRYRDRLEELVQQRTTELKTTNAQLQQEIGERRRTEAVLRHTADELARSNRDLEQFAYVASHDLQEPLRAVAGYVELLQHRMPEKLDPKAIQFITGAADGAIRMQTLINDLLAFSRVGTQGKGFRPTDLGAALDAALASLRVSIQETGARVTADPLPTLNVDGTQITQVFQNLIGNAIKFRSDQRPEVRVRVQRQADRWLFSICDNGIGLDPQYAERIFLIFQRLHTRRRYPGTGIGLAICKRIVERHEGRIWVESQPGQGAVFHFTLPDEGKPEP